MVGNLLIIQMPNASDEGSVTLRFRPIDCFFLGFESAELMVGMVFDYIILNGRAFRTTLRTGFDVNVRHSLLPLHFCQHLKLYEQLRPQQTSGAVPGETEQAHLFVAIRRASSYTYTEA